MPGSPRSITLESIRRQIEDDAGKLETPPPEDAELSLEENPAVVDENQPEDR